MTSTASSMIETGYAALWSLFGYKPAPAWRKEAETLQTNIRASLTNATEAAESAEDLLDERAVGKAGSGGLMRAGAQAGGYAKVARAAADKAAQDQRTLEGLLASNGAKGDAVGDNAKTVSAAAAAALRAEKAGKALQTAQEPAAAWHELSARLQGGIALRLEQVKKQAPPKTAQRMETKHRDLTDRLDQVAKAAWSDDATADAVKAVRQGVKELDDWMASLEGQAATDPLPQLRKTALQRYNQLVHDYDLPGLVRQATESLQEQDPRIEPQHLVGAAAITTLDARGGLLQTALGQATTPGDIDKALAAALKDYRDGVAALATQLDSHAGLASLKSTADAAIKREEDAALFERERADVAELLADVRRCGVPEAKARTAEFNSLVAETYKTQNYGTAATVTLPKLRQDISKEEEAHRQKTGPELQRLGIQRDKLTRQLDAMKGKSAVFATLRANLEEAGNFLECDGNLEAAEPARGILAEVEAMLANPGTASDFSTLETTLVEVENGLKNKVLAQVGSAEFSRLKTALARLQKPTHGLSPKDFKAEVLKLKADLVKEQQFADALTNWRRDEPEEVEKRQKDFGLYAGKVRAAGAQFSGKAVDPAKGDLKARLDAVAALIKAPVEQDGFTDQKNKVTDRLKEYDDDLAKVWDGAALKDKALIAGDVKAGEDKAAEVAKVTRDWTAFAQEAKTLGATLGGKPQAAPEYEALMRQFTALKDAIAEDPDKAARQLADITARMRLLPGTPGYEVMTARAIAKAPAAWKSVLGATEKNLQSLLATITDASTGTPFEGGMVELKGVMEKAAAPFPATAFDAIVQTLADTAVDRDKRRTAREQGLRLVRQYQERLFKDPLFLYLQNNPFGVGLFGPLFRFLDQLELELLRVGKG